MKTKAWLLISLSLFTFSMFLFSLIFITIPINLEGIVMQINNDESNLLIFKFLDNSNDFQLKNVQELYVYQNNSSDVSQGNNNQSIYEIDIEYLEVKQQYLIINDNNIELNENNYAKSFCTIGYENIVYYLYSIIFKLL